MFIDIHAHAYRKPDPYFRFGTAEDLIRKYDELGIEKGVVLPIVSPEIYMPQANEDILDMAEAYPDRLIPYCNVDPRALTNSADAPLDKVLSYYKEKGCKGVGEVMLNLPLMDPLVQNLFRHAEKVGLPIVFDGTDQIGGDFGLYDDPGLPQLEHTLQRFPDLLIFGHGPVFWSEIGRLETPGERAIIYDLKGHQVGRLPDGPIKEEGVVPKLMRRYPNLRGDLADGTAYNALNRDHEYGPKFLEEFQDRIYFGTDIISPGSVVHLVDLLIQWRDSGKISETVFNKVARENAKKLLGLE
ncbi:amidohydrolase family protein [Paenibacillus eucommiae]|uniref:TIM-barrel fold metal-dependent hydrolase n=1 Tax=Paenibacillus eucommiae TaxID=1355755 RepID=A0ABS4J016_9BACL|nr:amidohydrolase family protein [Paenibacillus eucommiae]MBP1993183.1 putative TIM-barrel fold metal-dependent hydrolase [Paenibacillus eucommiae]